MATNKNQKKDSGVGEGFPIAVTLMERAAGGQPGSYNAGFALQTAPAPTQRFVADGGGILPALDGFRFVFTQKTVDGARTRSLIDVYMPNAYFHQFCKTLGVFGRDVDDVGVLSQTFEEAKDSVSLTATFVRASIGENGGALDFFYASPFSINSMVESKQRVYVEPVVRVLLPKTIGLAMVTRSLKLEVQE